MNSTAGVVVISIGLMFNLFGCLSLVRMPDLYSRLQAAVKCSVFGACCILFGTFLVVGFSSSGMKCLLCIGFLLLTAPVGAHAIARGSHRAGVNLCEDGVVDKYAEDKEGEV